MEPNQSAQSESLSGVPHLLAALSRTVKAEPRLAEVELRIVVDAVELRRREALVIAVSVESLEAGALSPYLGGIAAGSTGVLFVGDPPQGLLERLPAEALVSVLGADDRPETVFLDVHGLLERVELRAEADRRSRWLNRYRYEIGELIEIARAITRERDIDRLLDLILEKSRFVTGADAGSIYVLEGADPDVGKRTLRFKLSQNESCKFESREFTVPISMRSIVGAAVLTHKAINIPDVYAIAGDSPYGFDRSFDEKVGYRSKSMITMPLISAQDEVIGVIQLINKKRDPHARLTTPDLFESEVVPFDSRAEDLLATLAAQAGIALENALLYNEIRNIFEGFVRASVQAIEQRDPTTSGHSLRVSVLSVALAETVDRADSGAYANIAFNKRDIKELEYASLLHDFGKIGVREEVLLKAKKLYPYQLEAIRARIDYAAKSEEAAGLTRKLGMIKAGAGASDLLALDAELTEKQEALERAWQTIAAANEPTVLKEGDFSRIAELGTLTYHDARGEVRRLLSEDEIVALQVTKGSLQNVELEEIRSHVRHTYDFLARIPWGKTFNRIPLIAGAHHERLNGNGYPRGLKNEQIPLQSKIMSIADIYDALTARDRPYKKALPVERALDILGFEVKEGHVDGELVRIFREAEVYKVVERELSY